MIEIQHRDKCIMLQVHFGFKSRQRIGSDQFLRLVHEGVSTKRDTIQQSNKK